MEKETQPQTLTVQHKSLQRLNLSGAGVGNLSGAGVGQHCPEYSPTSFQKKKKRKREKDDKIEAV